MSNEIINELEYETNCTAKLEIIISTRDKDVDQTTVFNSYKGFCQWSAIVSDIQSTGN
jgi:hypothetical protein